MFRHQFGMLPQAVAGSFDLHDDGQVKNSSTSGRDRVTRCAKPPRTGHAASDTEPFEMETLSPVLAIDSVEPVPSAVIVLELRLIVAPVTPLSSVTVPLVAVAVAFDPVMSTVILNHSSLPSNCRAA